MTTPATGQLVDYEIATSERRLIARLIDLAIGYFGFSLIGGLFLVLLSTLLGLGSDAAVWSFAVVPLLLLIAYDTVMLHYTGKTLGKMALGLRVVDIKGDKLTWGNCLVRSVVLYLCGLAIAFFTVATLSIFGWIFIMGLKRYKRFPQDSAAHSFVVRERKGQLVKATVSSPPKPTPLADLDRLYEQGMITKEEWERKKAEIQKS